MCLWFVGVHWCDIIKWRSWHIESGPGEIKTVCLVLSWSLVFCLFSSGHSSDDQLGAAVVQTWSTVGTCSRKC